MLTARSFAITTKVALTSDMAALPIIRIETQAPDVSRAIKLANAAVDGLSGYLDAKAADETVPDRRRLRVRALGTAQGHEATRGPSRMMGFAIAVFAFFVGCGALLAMTALARDWREAEAIEQGLATVAPDPAAELPDRADSDLEWDLSSASAAEARTS